MNYIPIAGLILNPIGSIVLAFTLTKTIKIFDTSITALELFKDTYLSKENVISLTGMDSHRKNVKKKSSLYTKVGLAFLIIGFILQIVALTA